MLCQDFREQTLHDRMLFLSELLGVFVAQPADDSQCGELRFRRKPVLDRSNVRVEFGRLRTLVL